MQRIHVPALAVSLLFAAVSAMAQVNHANKHVGTTQGNATSGPAGAKSGAPGADMAMGDGLVKKVDKTKGTVTLAHGALPNGMPPMTMAYKVKDAAWLDTLQTGQKIRFATDPADGGMTVSHMELAK